MQWIGWIIASLPLFGLVGVLAEIAIRDPRVIEEMALDYEAFAQAERTPMEQVNTADMGLAHA